MDCYPYLTKIEQKLQKRLCQSRVSWTNWLKKFLDNAEFLKDLIGARASYDFLLFRLELSPFVSDDAIVSSYLGLVRTYFRRFPILTDYKLKELIGFAKLFDNLNLRLTELQNIREELLSTASSDKNHTKWMQIVTIFVDTTRAKLSGQPLNCLEAWRNAKSAQNVYYSIKDEFKKRLQATFFTT